MSYAPILDPAATAQGPAAQRRLVLAAAAALRQLAQGDASQLRQALELLDAPNGADRLRELPGVQAVLAHAAIESAQLLPHLQAQLHEVKAFGELDGGALNSFIGPVSRLIQDGRVELFAGASLSHGRSSGF